ncbi:MAG TPA: lipoprotein-releasing ABC transporter permease subunit [Verrucomicrobiae bacterium]|jgi:lipoprotein-releasing system permease protein|nr:lipoprotein-releasing ABC transporter permease subunit [Verrucomicrobiae bacterium]
MNYELFIGLRYLRGRRRETFISLITVISILGVMIGVMTLIVVMSVMTGFEETLRDRLLGINSHISVLSAGETLNNYEAMTLSITAEPGVVAASPAVLGQAMLTSGSHVSGTVVRGIDPDRANRVLDIQSSLQGGTLQDLKGEHKVEVEGRPVSLPGVILGARLAQQLRVGTGDVVQVVSPMAQATVMGMIPKIRRFVVVAVFKSGMQDYDATLMYMNLPDAQNFFDLGKAATSIEVRVKDVYQAEDIARRIQQRLGIPYFAEDWSKRWPSLFSALRLEKTVYFLVLLLMILVGAFNIISTLVMVVMEKRRDIAILQSMGARRASIRNIFLIKGCVIGGVGTVLGIAIGYGLCLLLQEYHFIKLPDVFLMDTVPVRLYLSNFILVAAASFLICLLASIYPARQASKLDPVEIIRYE